MRTKKLQFTLFSKILFVASTIIFVSFFLFYYEATSILGPYIQDKEALDAFYIMIYLALSICIVSVIIATFFLAKSITKPIKKLVEITQQIGLGNFEVKASDSIKSSDEIGVLSVHFDEMAKQLRSRQYLKNILSKLHGKVLSEQFVEGALEKRANLMNVAVMFLDIRDFTRYSEAKNPEEVVASLNRFFEEMGVLVKKHGGVIDKFMGDSLMAVWGIPESRGSLDAINAFECSMDMNRSMDINDFGFEIGIGVHYGSAILGCIGSRDQQDYTLIGDVINTASRIQKQTRKYQLRLMISEALKSHLSLEQARRLQGEEQVKIEGKDQSMTLYSLYPMNNIKAA